MQFKRIKSKIHQAGTIANKKGSTKTGKSIALPYVHRIEKIWDCKSKRMLTEDHSDTIQQRKK